MKRFTKILPMFYFVFLMYIVLSLLGVEIFQIENKWATFLLLSNIPILYGKGIGVSWSLCVEEHFYILFALTMYFLRKKIDKIRIWHFGMIFFLFVIIRFIVAAKSGLLNQGSINMSAAELNNFVWKQLVIPSYCRMDGILLGVFVGYIQIFREKLFQSILGKTKYTIFLAPFVYYLLLYIQKTMWLQGLAPISRGVDIVSLTVGPIIGHVTFFLIFMFGLNIPKNNFGFLGSVFSFIAKISYPLYLIHHVIIEYLQTLNFNVNMGMAIAVLSSIFLSYLLYYIFERKMMIWLRRRLLQ